MKSIQGRLIIVLTAAAVVLLLLVGLVFYWAVRADLVRQFDYSLRSQAEALSSLVLFQPNGDVVFEFDEMLIPEFQRSQATSYFVICLADGRVIAASKSWSGAAPAVGANGEGANVLLPAGRPGPALRLDFVPHLDADSSISGNSRVWTAAPVSIVVARDRRDLDAASRRFLLMLTAAIVAMGVTITFAVILAVRRALGPLRSIRDSAASIGPANLHLRLPEQGLPAELAPICTCLNELLHRLDAAFARERRFTSDVAHELRTPIAELRSVTEIAIRHPDDPTMVQAAVSDSHDIARQMQTLVNTLLALVRSERMPTTPLQPVQLSTAVLGASRASGIGADDLHCEIPVSANVMAEPTLLASALRNVISNALEYRSAADPIRCSAVARSGGWELHIENTAESLTPDDLAHLFEPFWRKDAARSDGQHVGLGLALVRAYCELMGVTIAVTIREPAIFRLTMAFVAAAQSPSHRLASAREELAPRS